MLKIGDFSRLAHVTVKTLHHYGKVGLLKPAWIDRFSGYRYYTLQQLPRLNRILALKELGFTLDEIRPILDASLPLGNLRQVLSRKQVELEQSLHEEKLRLGQVESRLKQIEKEGSLAGYEVVTRRMEAQTTASVREVLPGFADLPGVWSRVSVEIRDWLKTAGIRLDGPWFASYLDPEYSERNVHLELGVVVEPLAPRRLAGSGGGRVTLRRLPGVECMASVLHSAGMETIPQAYAALYGWIEQNGCQAAGRVREVYLDDCDEQGRSSRMVELQLPVRRNLPDRGAASGLKNGESKMEYKIVNKPSFMVMGLKYQGKNQNQEISQLWGVFNQRMEKLQLPIQDACYGLCFWLEGVEEGVFEYVAGLGVKQVDVLPEGFVVRIVPAYRYAVFAHTGALNTLGETYRKIYQEWLPESGEKVHPDRYDMEVYDELFKFGAPDSIMWIYVALE